METTTYCGECGAPIIVTNINVATNCGNCGYTLPAQPVPVATDSEPANKTTGSKSNAKLAGGAILLGFLLLAFSKKIPGIQGLGAFLMMGGGVAYVYFKVSGFLKR